MTNVVRRVFTIVSIAVGALFLAEAVLQVTVHVNPRAHYILATDPHNIADKKLGWRAHPGHPEHDRRGFRNPQVPEQVTVVAIGDSQTYGLGVDREEPWPQQLKALLGLDTYNKAYGGYGPLHHLLLLDEALALNPSIVIATLYTGNDFYDTFRFVYKGGGFPELQTKDPKTIEVVEEAQRLTMEYRKLPKLTGEQQDSNRPHGLRVFLSENSKVWAVGRATKRLLLSGANAEPKSIPTWEELKANADAHPSEFAILEYGNLRTILTPDYRLLALDMDSQMIVEGMRLSMEGFRLMKERADAAGVAFAVLVIPTKELAFKDVIGPAGLSNDKCLARLIENEELALARAIAFLEEHDIPTMDARPYLAEKIARGEQPYPIDEDGHPNAMGHRIIAQCVHDNVTLLELSTD